MKYLKIFIIVMTIMFTAASCGDNSAVNSNNTEETQKYDSISPNNPTIVRVNHYVNDTALPYADNGTLLRWAEYEYNADGNKTKKTNYDNNNTLMSREEYEYDSNGNQIKLTLYSHPGSYLLKEEEPSEEDVLIGWYDFQYDSDGNQVKAAYYNADGSIDRWSEYLYDAKGRIIKETSYSSDGSTDWLIHWNEYEYEDNEEKIIITMYNGGDGSFNNHTKRQYNKFREQFEETYYNRDGEIIGISAYSYQYDDDGRVIKEIHYSSDGNVFYWLEYQY